MRSKASTSHAKRTDTELSNARASKTPLSDTPLSTTTWKLLASIVTAAAAAGLQSAGA